MKARRSGRLKTTRRDNRQNELREIQRIDLRVHPQPLNQQFFQFHLRGNRARKDLNAAPEIRKMAYGRMITSLYGELGYYYWCPAIELNGMGEDIDEILRLVKEILSSPE